MQLRGDTTYDTNFAQRELEATLTRVAMRDLKPLTIFDLLNIQPIGGEWAESTRDEALDGRAEFREQAPRALDAPEAQADRQSFLQGIKRYFTKTVYTADEMAKYAHTGMPVPDVKEYAVLNAWNELVQTSALYGNPSQNIFGFFNHPRIKVRLVKNADALNKDSSADDLFDAIMDIHDAVETESSDARSAETIVLPSNMFKLARRKHFNAIGVGETVLERVRNITGADIRMSIDMQGVSKEKMGRGSFTGGTNGVVDVALSGVFDEMTHTKVVPVMARPLPAHVNPVNDVHQYWSGRIGGLHIQAPKAIVLTINCFGGSLT